MRYDRPYLVFETHIEHLVSLINYQESATARQAECLLSDHFNQSTRSSHDYLILLSFDIFPEFMLIDTTENREYIYIESFAVLSVDLINLIAKFSCWCENQADGSLIFLENSLIQDMHEHWNQKSESFA